jgi:hypothetical protein
VTRRAILAQIGAVKLTGTGLIETVEEIFRESNVNPTDAVAALNQLSDEVEVLSRRVDRLIGDLAAFDLGVDRLEPGQCEIAIAIPASNRTMSMEDLAQALKQFDQYLRPIVQVAQGDSSSGMMLTALGSPDWQLSLRVDLMSVAVFSVVMRQIGEVQLRLDQRKELRKSTEALYPPYVLEEMDRADAELFAAEYRRIAEEVVDEYGPKNESTDELKVLMNASVKFLAERLEENVIFDFRAEPEESVSSIDMQADPAEADRKRERIVAAQQVNLSSGTLLAMREGRSIPTPISTAILNDSDRAERVMATSNGS